MSRKAKETPEEEIQVSQPEKKKPFVKHWFETYAVNNTDEIKITCDLTARSAEEQFSMYLTSNNTETYAVIFYATFMQIIEFLRSKESMYKKFSIEICNSINIGYVNNNDENFENGNIEILIEHIGTNRNIVDSTSNISINRTDENFIRWKELNIKKNVEYYKEIQERAYNTLKSEYHINLRTSEAIIPLFCIFVDNLVNVLRTRWKESEGTDVSQVSMNVLGLFDIFYSFDEEENQEIIEFDKRVSSKLGVKDDNSANRE
jgi:hypothetical protein